MSSARETVMRAIEQACTLVLDQMASEDRLVVPEAARTSLRQGVIEASEGLDDAACECLAAVPTEQFVEVVRDWLEPEAKRVCAPMRCS